MTDHRTLYWAVSGLCQLHCRYCFYETGMSKRLPRFVDSNSAVTAIRNLAGHFDSVVFTGGEPLLNPSFWDIVELSRSSGMTVSFLSNGLLLNHECIQHIRQLGVSRVYISLDSLSEPLNDMIRAPSASVANATKTILRNVEAIASERQKDVTIVILQTICKASIEEIEPMIRFCQRLGIGLLVHPAGIPQSCLNASDIRLESSLPQEILNLEKTMLKWSGDDEGLVRYTRTVIALLRGDSPENQKCLMGDSAFFLNVDGAMHPCFHRTDLLLGNIYNTPVAQMLSPENLWDLSGAPCMCLACACMLE